MCNVDGPPIKRGRAEKLSTTDPLPIYLDHNATTPVCDEAWAAMISCRDIWGNPSSTHPYGSNAKFYVEECREKVANCINAAEATQIIFTSGGTESNNLGVIGGCLGMLRLHPERCVVISSLFEHPAIEEVLKHLERTHAMHVIRCVAGAEDGVVSLSEFEKLVEHHKDRLLMVTLMHAQNEIGSIQPISQLVKVVRRHCGTACLFHTDAAQSVGKEPVDVRAMDVDMLSICSHKFYGPKGVGALYCREPAVLQKVQFGAPHERGIRPGTENIILIMGMTAALVAAVSGLDAYRAHARRCRDALFEELKAQLGKVKMVPLVNGSLSTALPNTLNVAILHQPTQTFISANRLIHEIQRQVCCSAGSACHSTAPGETIVVSQALQAVGCDLQRAMGTLRLTTGHVSTEGDMKRAARLMAQKARQQIPEIL